MALTPDEAERMSKTFQTSLSAHLLPLEREHVMRAFRDAVFSIAEAGVPPRSTPSQPKEPR